MAAAPKRKRRKAGGFATPAWMVTYGDMTTLLLTFFILMFTVAEIEGYELRLILSPFTGSFGMEAGGLTLQKGPLAEMGQVVETLPSQQAGNRLAEAKEEATELFRPEVEAQQVRLTYNERGLVITLTGDVFFNPGSAEILPPAYPILNKVANLIVKLKNPPYNLDKEISVEGHTSSTRVIDYSQLQRVYESNWELGAQRAVNVVKYFTEVREITPYRINEEGQQMNKFNASTYGPFRPIDENQTPEGRANNRRVDIIIERGQ
jgi:chemotaxis protein MotB